LNVAEPGLLALVVRLVELTVVTTAPCGPETSKVQAADEELEKLVSPE
jgi:hypothetical protein